jgi:hypothetical protein
MVGLNNSGFFSGYTAKVAGKNASWLKTMGIKATLRKFILN